MDQCILSASKQELQILYCIWIPKAPSLIAPQSSLTNEACELK